MKLTARQRELLGLMAAGEDCVEEGREVWVGGTTTNVATLLFFMRHMLVRLVDMGGGGLHYYELTDWGKRALTDATFEPLLELEELQRKAAEAEREETDGDSSS